MRTEFAKVASNDVVVPRCKVLLFLTADGRDVLSAARRLCVSAEEVRAEDDVVNVYSRSHHARLSERTPIPIPRDTSAQTLAQSHTLPTPKYTPHTSSVPRTTHCRR
jgi:hypothetical protein